MNIITDVLCFAIGYYIGYKWDDIKEKGLAIILNLLSRLKVK